MRNTRRIIPYALLSGLLVSCVTDHKLARVRISQPQMKEAVADTGFRLPRQITWTDDKGKEHIVTEATKDSVTGEYITQMELSEITVMAKSKQVAERNGKINLDFIVTVPGELISNKWQVQLTPVAYKPADTLYLDRIFLSGADFALINCACSGYFIRLFVKKITDGRKLLRNPDCFLYFCMALAPGDSRIADGLPRPAAAEGRGRLQGY